MEEIGQGVRCGFNMCDSNGLFFFEETKGRSRVAALPLHGYRMFLLPAVVYIIFIVI